MVVNGLGKQVGDILFAASTVDRPNVLFSEHGTLLVRLLVLHGEEHIVEALNLK